MDGMTIDFELQKDCTLKVCLDDLEKRRLQNKFSEFLKTYNAMALWFDSPSATGEQKITYLEHLENMLQTMNFMFDFMVRVGIKKEEIVKEINTTI